MLKEFVFVVLLVTIATGTKVEISSAVIAEVTPSFLSFTVDDAVFNPSLRWGAFNSSSPRLHTLMSGLSPAIWRVGGSPADWLAFDIPQDKLNMSAAKLRTPLTMTRSDWDNMVQLSRKTGVRLLFDLDLQQRQGSHWSMTNAIKLFEYCQSQGYGENLDWELGNEPNVYNPPDQVMISPDLVGEDFVSLAKLVRSYKTFSKSRIVGPDVVGIAGSSGTIMKGFLEKAGSYVHAATLHHYYFRGDVAKWTEYINPKHFSDLDTTLTVATRLIKNSSYPQTPLWIGETSDAWHSGTAHVSDRYISAFLWLDKLGVAAQHGVGVVMRQTFWGHNYGLINDSMLPNPDYWLSYAHKRLVGADVLGVTTNSCPLTTRIYAHCTLPSKTYKSGGITLFMLNVNTTGAEHMSFTGALVHQNMDVYLMTPGDDRGLLAQTVALNGHVLQMVDDYTLPVLKPVTMAADKGFTLPPTTYAFIVFPDAQLKACM